MDENNYKINGFVFSDRTDYETALKEYNNILGLQEKMDVDDIEGLKLVFIKLVTKNYFRTPVGINFLYELRDYIAKFGGDEDLPAIPVPKLGESKNKYDITRSEEYVRLEEELDRTKAKKNKMLIAICALTAIIIGMIFITLTNDNSGFFNAEEKVLDKYSAWQEQLEEKEEELRDREEALKKKQ